jgi:copper homeostasis protein (lipoprotein)
MLMIPSIKRSLRVLMLSFVLVSLGVAACAPSTMQLEGSSWALASIRDEAGDMAPALPGAVVTAHFQIDQISGESGCNTYSGSYAVDGNKLRFGALATTRQACPEADIMKQESAFLSALEQVASYKIDGDRLELRDGKGDSLLIFTTL